MGYRMRFPLIEIHENAQAAAEAAEAAAAQGKFWEMYDRLFEARRKLGHEDLGRYAGEVGLDVAEFEKDLERLAYAGRVEEDLTSGRASGVRGTPTFFVDGVRHEGSHDFETLLAAMEEAEARGNSAR